MARAAGGRKTGQARKRQLASLRLERIEPAGSSGMMLVYHDPDGREQTWIMEQATVTEFLALMLHGKMRKGRRVVIDDVDVTIEPPEKPGGLPILCLATGPLESCATLDRPTLKALRADIDALLR